MHVTKLKANKAKCLIKDMTNPDDCLELNPYEKFLQNTEEWTSEGGSFSKGGCNVYGSDIKNCFFYLMSEKNMNALAAAKELNVPMSTAHAWKVAKKASDEGAPIIRKKKGRVPLLSEEHARFLTNLFDKNPSLAIHEVVKSLRDQFADTQISDKTVYYFVTKKCNITLGKAFTRTVERNSPETIEKRYRWAIKQKKTTMNFMDNCVFIDQITTRVRMKTSADLTEKKKAQPPTVIFGAISMYGLVNVFEGSAKSQTTCKKKDVAGDSSRAPKKTQKSEYFKFIDSCMDVMDDHPKFTGHYLVMDNAPIDERKEIQKRIKSRGYHCTYLPSYSVELSPIKKCWVRIRNGLKKKVWPDEEPTIERIRECCTKISIDDIKEFHLLSESKFKDSLERKPF